MTGLEIIVAAAISVGAGITAGVLRSIARGPQPLPDDHPDVREIAKLLCLNTETSEDAFQLTTNRFGYTILIRISKQGGGRHTVVTVPLKAALTVPFLIDQRSPNRPAGASLGIAGLDEHLQVRSPALHTGDDFSWLTGQMLNMEMAQMAELAPMLADEALGRALRNLVPENRNRSYINAHLVHIEESTAGPAEIQSMIADAAFLAKSIDLASDGEWSRLATNRDFEVSDFDENGHRQLTGWMSKTKEHSIQISVKEQTEGPITTIQIDAGLPPFLTLSAREQGDQQNKLGNPLLDMHVVAAHLPDDAKIKISDPNQTPALLSIFHAHPRSLIHHGKIFTVLEGKPNEQEMNDAIVASTELAVSLQAAFRNENPEPASHNPAPEMK